MSTDPFTTLNATVVNHITDYLEECRGAEAALCTLFEKMNFNEALDIENEDSSLTDLIERMVIHAEKLRAPLTTVHNMQTLRSVMLAEQS